MHAVDEIARLIKMNNKNIFIYFFFIFLLEIKSACDYGNLVNAILGGEMLTASAKNEEKKIELQFRIRIL